MDRDAVRLVQGDVDADAVDAAAAKMRSVGSHDDGDFPSYPDCFEPPQLLTLRSSALSVDTRRSYA